MPTNSDIEGLWSNAWSDLYEIIKDRWDARCLLPDGEIVDVEACKDWLQESAYSGYVPAVSPGWVLIPSATDSVAVPKKCTCTSPGWRKMSYLKW